MDYKKPQSTLVQGGTGIYPLTTADQVILADGSRLEKDGKIRADTAADSAKLGGKAPEYYLQMRNLLDNSDFSNLIAQAGLNGAHGSIPYIADRWKSSVATATVNSGYTTLTTSEKSGRIVQKLPDTFAGKTITVAAKISGTGVVHCGVYYTQNATAKSVSVSVTAPNGVIAKNGMIPSDATDIEYRIYISYTDGGGSCDVYWAALYEGSYTADTLPPYVPKGYAVELAECQRYCQIIKAGFPIIGTSYTTGTSSVNVRFPLPIKMRINPAVTADATQIGVVDKGNTPLASSATYSMINNNLDMSLKFSSDVFEKSFISVSPYSAVDIQLSADL